MDCADPLMGFACFSEGGTLDVKCMRAVKMFLELLDIFTLVHHVDVHGSTGNPFIKSCDGGFPWFLREQMRGLNDLLWQNPSSLFILLGQSSISVAFLMLGSLYWGLVWKVLVLCPS